MRNALHVLTRIVDVFPGMKKLCDHLEKKVKVITEDDSRKDLQVQELYFTMLQKAKPNLQTQENFLLRLRHQRAQRWQGGEEGRQEVG